MQLKGFFGALERSQRSLKIGDARLKDRQRVRVVAVQVEAQGFVARKVQADEVGLTVKRADKAP